MDEMTKDKIRVIALSVIDRKSLLNDYGDSNRTIRDKSFYNEGLLLGATAVAAQIIEELEEENNDNN